MNMFSYPKFEGNQRVIRRFSDLGFTPEQIAEKYQEKGIEITAKTIEVSLSGELETLARNSYPKKEVKAIEDEVRMLEGSIPSYY